MKILAIAIIKTAYDDELMTAMMKMLAVTDSLKHMTVELVHAMNTFKAVASLFFTVFHQHAVSVPYTNG